MASSLHGPDPNLLGLRRLSPVSDFLVHHPGRPTSLCVMLPWDERGLHRLAGYGALNKNEETGTPLTTRRGHGACAATGASYLVPGLFRWREVARRWPALQAWLVGPLAFVPPETWPWPDVAERLGYADEGGPVFHPLLWHLSMIDRRGQPRSATVPYKAPSRPYAGLQALSAAAAGWPFPEPERTRADVEAAVGWLTAQPQWYVYVRHPDLTILPPYTLKLSPIQAITRKNELTRLPLSCTRSDLRALPLAFRSVEGLRRLPTQPFTLARTQRPVYLAHEGERKADRWTLPYTGPWFGTAKTRRHP